MRRCIGFLVAIALLASPFGVSARASEHDAGDEPVPKVEPSPHETRIRYTERLFVESPMPEEVTSPSRYPGLAFLLIPEHLQQRIPGASRRASLGLEYKEKEPEKSQEELEREKRRMRLGLGLGLGLGLPLVIGGVAAGAKVRSDIGQILQ